MKGSEITLISLLKSTATLGKGDSATIVSKQLTDYPDTLVNLPAGSVDFPHPAPHRSLFFTAQPVLLVFMGLTVLRIMSLVESVHPSKSAKNARQRLLLVIDIDIDVGSAKIKFKHM